MNILDDDTSIMRLVKDQLKNKTKHKNLMNLLKRYFTAIEEELPEPLNNSSLYVSNIIIIVIVKFYIIYYTAI